MMLSESAGGLEELAPADDVSHLQSFHRVASHLQSFHRVAAGSGLSAAGIVVFAFGFLEYDVLLGLPVGLLVATAIYLVTGFGLPNARVPE